MSQNLPHGTLHDVEPPSPTMAKNEGLLDVIKRYRGTANELRARVKAIANAPITVAKAKEKMGLEGSQLVQRGRPNIAPRRENYVALDIRADAGI